MLYYFWCCAVTEPSVISHDSYLSDICQVAATQKHAKKYYLKTYSVSKMGDMQHSCGRDIRMDIEQLRWHHNSHSLCIWKSSWITQAYHMLKHVAAVIESPGRNSNGTWLKTTRLHTHDPSQIISASLPGASQLRECFLAHSERELLLKSELYRISTQAQWENVPRCTFLRTEKHVLAGTYGCNV